MSKTTNKCQMELLLNAMQGRPDVAKGFFKGNKEDLNGFWQELEGKLNSVGPPTKSVAEWKKVWGEQKKYVRQKAAHDLKAREATGGGPNAELRFTATDESIYNLIGMRESVEGVALTFGLNTSCENPGPLQEVALPNDENDPVEPPPKRTKTVSKEPSRKTAACNALQEELVLHKEMVNIMKQQQECTKKLYRSVDRMTDLKKKELAEQKRHNLEMERLKLKEVEDKINKNKKLLELEELKSNYY